MYVCYLDSKANQFWVGGGGEKRGEARVVKETRFCMETKTGFLNDPLAKKFTLQ